MIGEIKCKGDGCPVKECCKRFNTTTLALQSYFIETPGDYVQVTRTFHESKHNTITKHWACDMYLEIRQDSTVNNLKI